MTSKRIQPWRWWIKVLQALFVLGVPFLKVQGESALRFDVPSLTLHFFGSKIGMDEFFLVLVAVLFLGFLLVLLTILFGRIWCGWLCPQTVIIDFTRFIDQPAAAQRSARLISLGAVLLISIVLAASLLWYFVSPYEFIGRLYSGELGGLLTWSWAVLTGITFLNFAFFRHGFCRTVCPYAKMQEAFYDDRTLVIGTDRDRMTACMHCDACVRICPVQIDVRTGLNAACVNCAECIDACARQMDRRGLRSLIGYRFGTAPTSHPVFRRGVILAAAATTLFAALLIYLTASRLLFDISVASDAESPPRRGAGVSVINTYVFSFTNRADTDTIVHLSASLDGSPMAIRPVEVRVPADSHIRAQIDVQSDREIPLEGPARTIRITASTGLPQTATIELETSFLPPWGPP